MCYQPLRTVYTHFEKPHVIAKKKVLRRKPIVRVVSTQAAVHTRYFTTSALMALSGINNLIELSTAAWCAGKQSHLVAHTGENYIRGAQTGYFFQETLQLDLLRRHSTAYYDTQS